MIANDSGTTKTNRNQEKALAALLVEKSIADAAKTAGVSEATLLRWLKGDEAFKEAYRDARREVVSHAVTQLQQACGTAVQALVDIAGDTAAKEGSRVAAARAILDLSVKGIELEDLAERIEKLEAMQDVMQDTANNGRVTAQ